MNLNWIKEQTQWNLLTKNIVPPSVFARIFSQRIFGTLAQICSWPAIELKHMSKILFVQRVRELTFYSVACCLLLLCRSIRATRQKLQPIMWTRALPMQIRLRSYSYNHVRSNANTHIFICLNGQNGCRHRCAQNTQKRSYTNTTTYVEYIIK